ncbi:hypothetical protein M5K25_024105 [Dendrobium thyrsiflorum]|uniref:DUF659 domain-containing protein n=1 Tax=Dendrobium thyrsiflorum TaxID=117978 RepID=A0ABD0U1B2_DENTH
MDFERVGNTERNIKKIKRTWVHIGVTIMFDRWSDVKSRSLINLLINNIYGTVFFKLIEAYGHDIGEHLIVQLVIDNVSAYMVARTKLVEKRKHLYWTPCVTHCINLIFKKLG